MKIRMAAKTLDETIQTTTINLETKVKEISISNEALFQKTRENILLKHILVLDPNRSKEN